MSLMREFFFFLKKRLKKGSFVQETREEYGFYSLQERKKEDVFNFKKWMDILFQEKKFNFSWQPIKKAKHCSTFQFIALKNQAFRFFLVTITISSNIWLIDYAFQPNLRPWGTHPILCGRTCKGTQDFKALDSYHYLR